MTDITGTLSAVSPDGRSFSFAMDGVLYEQFVPAAAKVFESAASDLLGCAPHELTWERTGAVPMTADHVAAFRGRVLEPGARA